MVFMKVAFFFTYGYSLQTWKDSGTLKREMKILELLSSKYNYEFTLFTYGDSSDLSLIESDFHFDLVPIHNVIKKSSFKTINFLKSFLYPFFLKKKLSKFDLIHQHQLQGVWITLLVKILYKIPLVVRTGYDVYSFSKFEQKSKLKIYAYKSLTHLALKFSSLYTVTSTTDFEMLSQDFSANKSNLKITPNHVEINKNTKNYLERFQNKILSVGRLVEQKNFDVLIDEFSGTTEVLKIDIVGSGVLEESLKELGVNKEVNVSFLGNFAHDELMNLYQDYRFFVSTSTFEGNPKTILEAMSAGCIVIVSNIKNHSELITNGSDGILFDLKSPNLKEIISTLSNNISLCEEISTNAKNRVKKQNSIEAIAEKIDNDYKSLLQS
jgi:glycosyltransferase involved in cell wall biosynthesis